MIKKLFINQLTYLLQDTPSKEEYLSALQYLSDELKDTDDIDKIGTLLLDWRNDCCVQCDWCGKYHLADDMQCINGNWFCSDKCADEYAEDEEWTEATNRELQSMWNER